MSERYKVLGAMTALDEFTVEDIVTKTGVKPNTVQTLIARHKHILKEIGNEGTGRRGGQPKKYRIRPEAVDSLYSELEALYQNLPVRNFLESSLEAAEDQPQIPSGFLAAQETLLLRYPKARDLKEKQRILDLAELDYQNGAFAAGRLLSEPGNASLKKILREVKDRIQTLQKLAEVDLLVSSLGETEETTVRQSQISEAQQLTSQVINTLPSLLRAGGERGPFAATITVTSFRPESPHYVEAKNLLDQAGLAGERGNSSERAALLDQASVAIELLQESYSSIDIPEITRAYVDYEHGRLRFMKREHNRAKDLFNRAHAVFATSEKYSDEVARIDQHLACLAVDENSRLGGAESTWGEVSYILHTLRQLDNRSLSNYPVVMRLQEILPNVIREFSEREKELKAEMDAFKLRVRPQIRGRLKRGYGAFVERDAVSPAQLLIEPNNYQRLSFSEVSLDNADVPTVVMGHKHVFRTDDETDELRKSIALSSQSTPSGGPLSQMLRRANSKK